MSITLITGVPGSGKSLYGVSKILAPLVGTFEEKTGEDGAKIKIPRVIYTNVNGLQLDHILIEGGGTWGSDKSAGRIVASVKTDLPKVQYADGTLYEGNPLALRNWHNWAKPGAFICFDEFQKYWPPRPAGAAVPPDIQALDTHRHMGVDFLLITQNCANVDRHILGLVDRHLHVRRVANLPIATVYEWDHCSKTLNYKNSMAKTPWRYDKSAFKLYKSAELHTTQRRKVPAMVWFILAGLIGAGVGIPMVQARISDRVNGVSSSQPAAAAENKGSAAVEFKDGMKVQTETSTTSGPPPGYVAPLPVSEASAPFAQVVPVQIAGCIVVNDRCGCFDPQGKKVPAEPAQCKEDAGLNGTAKAVILEEPSASRPGDLETLAYMVETRQRGQERQRQITSLSDIR